MAQYSGYQGGTATGDTSALPSARLFHQLDAYERSGLAYGFFTDFSNFRTGIPSTTEIYWAGGWKAIGVATNGIFGQAAVAGSGLTLSTDAADNDYLHMQKMFLPFFLGASNLEFAFEARVKFASIADTKTDVFIGVGNTMTLSTAVPITTTAGDLATEKFVGFHRDATDGDELNTVHNDAAAAHTILKNGVHTLVADTFVKIGMRLAGGRLYYTINGLDAVDSVAVTATNFPDDAAMGVLIGQTAAAATGGLTTISWVKALQQRQE
jgi:hypothetical protein